MNEIEKLRSQFDQLDIWECSGWRVVATALVPYKPWRRVVSSSLLALCVLLMFSVNDIVHSFFKPPPVPEWVREKSDMGHIPRAGRGDRLEVALISDHPSWFSVRYTGGDYWREITRPIPTEPPQSGENHRVVDFKLEKRPGASGPYRDGVVQILRHRRVLFISFGDHVVVESPVWAALPATPPDF